MFRWFVRFATAALVGALVVWFWNRSNEDLLEEELEEEIPLEFEVTAQDVLAPGSLDGNGAAPDSIPAVVSAPEMAPTEPVAPEEPPADVPGAEATTPESATASTETVADASAKGDAPEEAPTDAAADAPATDDAPAEASIAAVEDAPAEPEALEDADATAETAEKQEILLDSDAPTPEGTGDNVMAIRGIGPKYAEKLAEMGITTFGALLGTPIDTLAVAFPRVTDAELQSWMEQALELVTQPDEPA